MLFIYKIMKLGYFLLNYYVKLLSKWFVIVFVVFGCGILYLYLRCWWESLLKFYVGKIGVRLTFLLFVGSFFCKL